MERSHRQLRTGFADGLCSYDADRFAEFDGVARCHVLAVALRTYAVFCTAGQHASDPDCGDARLLDLLRHIAADERILGADDFARLGIDHVVHAVSAVDTVSERLESRDLGDYDALRISAVLFVDDDSLRNIDETSGEVTGVCRLECGIRKTFTSAVRGNEVLEDGKTFAVVCLDRKLYDFTRRVTDKTSHTAKLRDLVLVTARTGVRHHPYRVELAEEVFAVFVEQEVVDFVLRVLPQLDYLTVSVFFGQAASLVLLFDAEYVFFRLLDDLALLVGDVHIEYGCGDRADSRIFVTLRLDLVEDYRSLGRALILEAVVYDLRQLFLSDEEVDLEVELLFGSLSGHEMQILRDSLVEYHSADRGVQVLMILDAVYLFLYADIDERLQVYLLELVSHHSFRGVSEMSAFAEAARLNHRKIIRTDDHILSRRNDRLTVAELQNVVGGKHEESRLCSRLDRKRYVNCHLVAVEVRVERAADERMQLYSSAFDEYGLKGLDTQSVQCRSTVEEYGVVFDNLFEDIPYRDVLCFFDNALCVLYILALAAVDQLFDDERLEQFERHFLRNTALVHLEFRTDDDNRTTGIVDTLTEKVLTETTLLTSEHSGKGFQLSVAGSYDRLTSSAVFDEGVDRFLEHSLFVSDDDVGSAQVEQLLQTVVTVDYSSVKIVEVAGRVSAAVERDHRSEFGRKNGENVEDHPFGTGVARTERVDDFESLYSLELTLAGGGVDDLFQILRFLVEVYLCKEFLYSFCAHSDAETSAAVGFESFLVFLIVDDLLLDEICRARVDYDILDKVQYHLDISRRHIERKAYSGRYALEIPYVGDGGSEFDMTHSLASDLSAGNFNAALVADNAFISDSLIFTAMAFPVLGRSENPLAEQTVFFGFLSSVIDGFGLGDFAVRPGPDFFGRCNAYLYRVKIVYFRHILPPYSLSSDEPNRSPSSSSPISSKRLASPNIEDSSPMPNTSSPSPDDRSKASTSSSSCSFSGT